MLDDVQRWLQTVYPGKRGTGVYATSMLAALEKIKEGLANPNVLMTAWTLFPRAGIIPNHEYTIVGTSTRLGAHYVQLVNPHRDRSGRVYLAGPKGPRSLKPVPNYLSDFDVFITSGAFEVELGDFLKSFRVREITRR